MCNTHGRRINNDRLVRSGSGYVGLHGPDFLHVGTPWFRGTDLRYGPDGGVYISDWCDLGECHDNDGVHRTSGRIFKVTYGKPKVPEIGDVAKLSDAELVQLQGHRNDWYVRAARRNLQERAAAGRDMKAVHAALLKMYDGERDVPRKLRALWALYVTGGLSEAWLLKQLGHESEHVRVWAVKLLVDDGRVSRAALALLVRLARDDASGLVRLFLASALQRLPADRRGDLAAALLAHDEDANDHNLPLMLWYGIEPLAVADPAQASAQAAHSRIPLVRRFIARRLTEDMEKAPAPINALLTATAESPVQLRDVLRGMSDALRGWRKAKAPAAWADVQAKLTTSSNKELRKLASELGVVFGDGRALAELRQTALSDAADGDARRAALKVLIDGRSPDLLPLLQKLAADRATAAVAMHGLAAFDDSGTPSLILRHYHLLRPGERPEAITTLASRPAYARALLQAMAGKQIPRGDMTAFHARQVRSFGDAHLTRQLGQVWGEVRETAKDRKEQIARYKSLLTGDHLQKADRAKGRLLFNQACATCHTLYGQGKAIAPDLTGANRDNLDYLLENIIDPSAVVAADFRMSVVALKDGRVLTGVVGEQTTRTLSVQTQTDRVKLERSEIEEVRPTALSLMPDGLLSSLTDAQVRDLIAYLMDRAQVPLPAAPPGRSGP
jgi:putative heme-binding domain-containing protein